MKLFFSVSFLQAFQERVNRLPEFTGAIMSKGNNFSPHRNIVLFRRQKEGGKKYNNAQRWTFESGLVYVKEEGRSTAIKVFVRWFNLIFSAFSVVVRQAEDYTAGMSGPPMGLHFHQMVVVLEQFFTI
jgi:hypothetical protein